MKRLLIISITIIVFFTWAFPALAAPVSEVETFGYTPERNRDGKVNGTALVPSWYHFGGPSYSQPLVLSGDKWGGDLAGKTIAITVEGNKLNGYICPEKEVYLGPGTAEPAELEPVWSVELDGDTPTKSHPTYHESGGRKYIYIGTNSSYLDIIDITDFRSVTEDDITSFKSPDITDITSAPLVLDWKGHEIVVATSGNTCKILVVADPHDKNKKHTFFINAAGYGRTSSSPAPVNGGKGFAIGVDQGQSKGEVQLYCLDDILELSNGIVVKKENIQRIRVKTASGVAASFSVDGNMLYFGDTQSNVYAYNTATHTLVWQNDKNAGIFSNRSPALTGSRVYFSAVGSPGESGKVLAINRSGHTAWSTAFNSRAMTAPAILRADNSAVLTGKGNGELALLDPGTGEEYSSPKVASPVSLKKYASGVTGEISAARDTMVATTEQGVVAFSLTDINFQAVSIDDGVPDGKKAKPGKTYTGTATFKYNGLYNIEGVGVGVFANDEYLKLKDKNGSELPKIEDTNSGTRYYGLSDLKPGDEITTKFDYTVPEDALTLTAAININNTPLANIYNEKNFTDNEVKNSVPVDLQNLWVEVKKDYKEATEGNSVSLNAIVHNDSGKMVNTRLVWKLDGKVINDNNNYDLISQETSSVTINPSVGTHTVTVEVNPDRDRPSNESTYEDNKQEIQVNVAPAKQEESGDIEIIGPDTIQGISRYTFTVKISGYLPYERYTDSDGHTHYRSVTYNLTCNTNAEGVQTLSYMPREPYGNPQKTKPIKHSWTEHYTRSSGYYTKKIHYETLPVGMVGISKSTLTIEASATRAGTARKVVNVKPQSLIDTDLDQTL